MRIATELNLKNNVRSVETHVAILSTRSYRLLADGSRELLEDYGSPAIAPSPALFSFVRLDEHGRVIEDIDVDRPLIEQEGYRRLYEYDEFGRLSEIADYDETDHLLMKWRHVFGTDGRKLSEEGWSPAGWLWSRSDFDDHDNLVRVTWFRKDGSVEREQKWRYQYSEKGNVIEQLRFSPDEPLLGSRISFYTPLKNPDSGDVSTPVVYRSVLVRDEGGRLRETVEYSPDGFLHERKVYDENGIIRQKSWSRQGSDMTTTTFDQLGRELEIRQVAPSGAWTTTRKINDVTRFIYDEHGNLFEVTTTGPDESLIHRTTNSYLYDERGNWIDSTEVELNQAWQTEPFHASFETIRRFTRKIDYFDT
jgi:YD repeat-containing protein